MIERRASHERSGRASTRVRAVVAAGRGVSLFGETPRSEEAPCSSGAQRVRGFVQRSAPSLVLALALAALSACSATRHAKPEPGDRPDLSPLRAGETGTAILCGKVITADGADRMLSSGLILVRNGRIAYVGERRAVPAGYDVLDCSDQWAMPGMVELHSHVHSGGFMDVNDMVIPVNPELRVAPAVVPGNPLIKLACASGITTLFGIPGSGTSHSGFGIVYKTKVHASFDDCVVRNPGGMKVAQAYNPERRAGDFGATRAGLSAILEDVNDKAVGANRQGRRDIALENLQKVHRGELPVLIHSAGSDSWAAAARMWHNTYHTDCVLSHGCFDAHLTAPWIAETGVKVNAGPRTMDYVVTRDGAITGTAAKYIAAGVKSVSVNTDAPVMPQEELFLQGSMSSRLGADSYLMMRAVTIEPAKQFNLAHRLGSLEVGKDADIVLRTGSPLDPRARVERVFIDGEIEYDRARDGQWF